MEFAGNGCSLCDFPFCFCFGWHHRYGDVRICLRVCSVGTSRTHAACRIPVWADYKHGTTALVDYDYDGCLHNDEADAAAAAAAVAAAA
jgi:hypothetical protein